MIVIQAQLEAIHRGLQDVEEHAKYLDGDILKKLGAGIKAKSKREVKTLVAQRSGAMYKGVIFYYNPQKKQVVVTNNTRSETSGARYPWVLAHGKRLDPRSGKVLKLKEIDWIERPGNQYMHSNKAEDDIQKVIDRFMVKLEKKGVLKYE